MTLPEPPPERGTDEAVFESFALAVLQRAEHWAQEQEPPTVFQRQFEFVGTSEWHEHVVPRTNYGYWLQSHLEEIPALSQTSGCINRLWEDAIIPYLLPRYHRPAPAA